MFTEQYSKVNKRDSPLKRDIIKNISVLLLLMAVLLLKAVLWIQIHCIWIRILKFTPILIRIRAPVWIRIQAFSQSYIFKLLKEKM